MKAWILHGVGDIRYEDADMPQPKAGEVTVAVKAAGICGSDIPRIYETGAHIHPLVPGHEFAGQVMEVGEGADTKWKNKRVGIFPLIPCGNCTACQKRYYELCRSYSYLGSRRDGGFAEYAAVPEWNLIELPDSVSYEEAAMLEPMAVAVHAMRRAALSGTDTVAVCGLGTIGLLLVMFLLEDERINPLNILVIGNKDFQKQTAVKMGIPENHYCDGRCEDVRTWLMEHTCKRGVDVFFECVGKNETYAQAVDAMAPAGRIILTGNPYTDMGLKKETYWKILRNQLTIAGTWNSSFLHSEDDDWNYVLDRLAGKRILPKELITHRLALENLVDGLKIMSDKTEDYVKIMGVI